MWNCKNVMLMLGIMVLLISCGGGSVEPVDPKGNAAILVVDDFQYSETEPTVQLPGNTCTATPDGQGHYVGEGAGHYAGEGAEHLGIAFVKVDKPHGDLVYSVIADEFGRRYSYEKEVSSSDMQAILLQEAEAKETPSERGEFLFNIGGIKWMGPVNEWKVDDTHSLLVMSVDTSGYNTTVISNRIEAAMDVLSQSDWQVERFVLNMSFVLIPCPPDGFALPEIPETFEEIPVVAAGVSSDGVESIQRGWFQLDQAYPEDSQSSVDISYVGDPISNFLLESVGNKRVISIAAAGNRGGEIPYAPAKWENVVSVSAGVEEKKEYANNGEVILEDGADSNGDGDNDIIGTSFSTPRLSVLAAYYLLEGGPINCSGNEPPLSYATISGTWDNLDLQTAVDTYCSTFLMP